jgi:hypothetical protein
VLEAVAVLPEHDVDIAGAPVCPMADHIVPVVVGAEVASELELPVFCRIGSQTARVGAHSGRSGCAGDSTFQRRSM